MGPGGVCHSMGGPPLPNQTMTQSSILSMIAQQANLTPEQRQQLDYLLTLNPEQVRETLEYTVLAFEHVAKTLEHRDRTVYIGRERAAGERAGAACMVSILIGRCCHTWHLVNCHVTCIH